MNRRTPDVLQDLWRARLGEMPEAAKLCQLDSLNEIPDAVLVVARRLSPKRRIMSFLSAYLRDETEDTWLSSFIDAVVHGTVAASAWNRGRILVRDVSFADQVSLPREQLLGCIGENPLLRATPMPSRWKVDAYVVGAPVLAEPNADYRTPMPKGAVKWTSLETEPIGDVDVAVRRWIAVRIAAVTTKKLGMNFTDAANAAAEYAPLSAWTPDAHAALRGLVRESQQLPADHPAPPGFRGPDEWFRD
jgi:hypothetical protein